MGLSLYIYVEKSATTHKEVMKIQMFLCNLAQMFDLYNSMGLIFNMR